MSYNYMKLNGRIIEKFGTQYKFAQALGLSERSVSLKLNNKVPWSQVEITKACDLLGIEPEVMSDYFFNLNVQ